jgi:hypothetical protein
MGFLCFFSRTSVCIRVSRIVFRTSLPGPGFLGHFSERLGLRQDFNDSPFKTPLPRSGFLGQFTERLGHRQVFKDSLFKGVFASTRVSRKLFRTSGSPSGF